MGPDYFLCDPKQSDALATHLHEVARILRTSNERLLEEKLEALRDRAQEGQAEEAQKLCAELLTEGAVIYANPTKLRRLEAKVERLRLLAAVEAQKLLTQTQAVTEPGPWPQRAQNSKRGYVMNSARSPSGFIPNKWQR